MVIVDAVLETERADGFAAWPVAIPPGRGLLALSGRMAPAEIGTAMAVLFTYNAIQVSALTADVLDRHLAEAEALTAPGGLRLRDIATRAEVAPGCCFGLESWRDWEDVVHGDDLWLGHSPSFRLEHGDGVVHIRRDDDAGPPVLAIETAELARQLIAVQRRLTDFLTLAGQWAADTVPPLAGPLVAALDEHLKITGTAARRR
ncbi:hypothetical protein OHR68_40480 [Spirillospora sp. NBC_00431]